MPEPHATGAAAGLAAAAALAEAAAAPEALRAAFAEIRL